jgi:probable rRNA maturation factor
MNYLELQIACTDTDYPDVQQFQRWLDAVLKSAEQDSEVVIRIVDEQESAELNLRYRHKNGPTNVLSFPFEAPQGVETDLLGDLLMCAPVIQREAQEQGKLAEHHWAHITVHGILHLLGYDHIQEDEADEMEALEIQILQTLEIANPYQDEQIL